MWHVYAKTKSGFHKHFGEGKSILPHQLVIHSDFVERSYIPCPGQKFPQQHGFSVEYTILCKLPCYNLPVHQPRTFQRPWLFACILTDFIISVWPRKDHNNCRQWFRLTISILFVNCFDLRFFFICQNGHHEQLFVFCRRNAVVTI